MSETTSSPSVHVHSMSPSSSFSSADSGPHSEPTSDEQPDLGAFTTVLREWTHLQPPPRIPVQIHSATSSTTSTYQPEQSTLGSDRFDRSQRSRHSRLSERTGESNVSSFTRPPSSSVQPEGSTVWNQAPIASYLYSQTPSNDPEEEDVSRDEAITPSSPHSALTVEIASEVEFPSFDGSSEHLADQAMELPIPVGSDGQRLDSRETARPEENLGADDAGESSSLTSREHVQPHLDASSLAESQSMHLQSQVGAPTNASSDSLFIPPLPSTIATAIPTASSLSLHSNNHNAANSSSTSTSTLITALLNRSRPIVPRSTSDSSYATNDSASSSNLSLLSYRISETPSESDQERGSTYPATTTTTSTVSSLGSLVTQQSLHTSAYVSSGHSNSLAANRQAPENSQLWALPLSNVSQSLSMTTNASPLPNPYSPSSSVPTREMLNEGLNSRAVRPTLDPGWLPSQLREVVNDFTPEQTPHETFTEPRNQRMDFVLVDDDDGDSVEGERPSKSPNYEPREDVAMKTIEVKQVADYTSNNARAGPSSQHSLSTDRRKAYTREPVEEREAEEEVYSYRYPNAYTPKSYAQAITPKGIPSTTRSNTKTMTQSDLSSRQPLSGVNDHSRQEHTNEQPSRLITLADPLLHSQYDTRSLSNIITQSSTQVTADVHMQQPSLYPDTQSTSSRSQVSTQTASIYTDPPVMPLHHTYPHSLLGLHALPASLVSPDAEDVPGFDFNKELGLSTNMNETVDRRDQLLVVENDLTSNILDSENTANPDIPSLGYLDEALRFIAAERARWTASREGPAQTVVGTSSHELHFMGASSGEEGERGEGDREGEAEWKRLDNEQDQQDQEQEQPKRRRRRKRPRTHAATLALPGNELDQFSSSVGETISTSSTGPSLKKKRRSKSVPASAAGAEGKQRAKLPEKTFLIPPPATPAITILRRPLNVQPSVSEDAAFDSENDGGKTPTNGVAQLPGRMVIQSSDDSPINLVGKKGRRVGRKEREREKLKKDMEREKMIANDPTKRRVNDDNISFGFEHDEEGDDDDGFEPEEIEEDEDDQGENDSISNMSLLQPPRRKSLSSHKRPADTAYIHSVIGIGDSGAYKSIPASPKRLQSDGELVDVLEQSTVGDSSNFEKLGGEDSMFAPQPTGLVVGERKKRARSKRVKSLLHAKSDPQLRLDANVDVGDDLAEPSSLKSKKGKQKAAQQGENEEILDMDRTQFQKLISASSATGSHLVLLNQKQKAEAPVTVQSAPPNGKRGRIIALARKLIQLFPEQQEELGKVVTRLERQDSGKTLTNDFNVGSGSLHKSVPISIPGVKRKKSKKGGHTRTASEGTGGEGMDFDDDSIGSRVGGFLRSMHTTAGMVEEEEEEEIDPRGRPPKKGDALIHVFIDHSNILIGLLSHLKRHPPQRKLAGSLGKSRPLPVVLTRATTSITSNDTSDPSSALGAVKSTSTLPLPIPSGNEAGSGNAASQAAGHPIPLPSFATTSRSLPASGGLSSYMAERRNGRSSDSQDNKDVDSDGNNYADEGADVVRSDDFFVGPLQRSKEKKLLKHLWHAALTLVLERGRPVTRRVVVTSSPLYQPMDAIERLGYELRVFIRVPDFGDGMDRERLREKHGSGKSNTGSSKGAQHTSPIAALAANISPKKGSAIGHARKLSGNISTESGSGDGSGNGSGGGTGKVTSNSSNAPNTKIKYREQGVDELLQLKLHQALAATDYVPEGSTIVLATGDGNVGQFNEDGFLGPVRTALRRGWKVELYAWEDGLSRSWRREFGAGSEWGRRGMFRVIGMEQFANSLLEASELLT